MLVLFKENDKLLVKCKVNLKRQVQYQNKIFKPNTNDVQYLNQEEVIRILTVNGNIRIWNGKKFVRLNLGQFTDIIDKNQYKVEVRPLPEVKKEVSKYQPKQNQQPKQQEVKKEEPKVVEPVKVEEPVVKQQPEVKEPEKVQEDENKKKRHNKNQGGEDK